MDRYAMDMKKDALFRGEFEVIKELVSILPDGEAAKRECDKVIDKNGPAKTGGTGIKQLRENIAESKLSYEIMDDAAQVFLKSKIMDNIHKYFYMIAFTGYIREMAALAISTATDEDKAKHGLAGGKISTPGDQLKLAKTFVAWMEEHAKLRTLVEEGKGKLQWERDIPASALSNLESLASSDFKANLGKIIHDIYQTAHTMFSGSSRTICKCLRAKTKKRLPVSGLALFLHKYPKSKPTEVQWENISDNPIKCYI